MKIGNMSATVFSQIQRFVTSSVLKCRNIRCYSKREEDNPARPVNELKKYFSANDQPTNGHIYDTKPFMFTCEAGKTYSWCLCGKSHKQPFCDGTHRSPHVNIKHRPIRFSVKETKAYWLCNCKQTSNRPFCDGSHNTLEQVVRKRTKQS